MQKVRAGLRTVPVPASEDVIALLGLGLLTTGLWWVSPALSLIVLGTLFLAGALMRARGSGSGSQSNGSGRDRTEG